MAKQTLLGEKDRLVTGHQMATCKVPSGDPCTAQTEGPWMN